MHIRISSLLYVEASMSKGPGETHEMHCGSWQISKVTGSCMPCLLIMLEGHHANQTPTPYIAMIGTVV